MNKLYLIRHMAGLPAFDYYGFIVKGGSWFGFIKTPFGRIPAAFSGWTCGGCIHLYMLTMHGWRGGWFDETFFAPVFSGEAIKEDSGFVILGEPEVSWFWASSDKTPFFVEYYIFRGLF